MRRSHHLLLCGIYRACAGPSPRVYLLQSTIFVSSWLLSLSCPCTALASSTRILLSSTCALVLTNSSMDCSPASARCSCLRTSTAPRVLPAPDPKDSPAYSPRLPCQVNLHCCTRFTAYTLLLAYRAHLQHCLCRRLRLGRLAPPQAASRSMPAEFTVWLPWTHFLLHLDQRTRTRFALCTHPRQLALQLRGISQTRLNLRSPPRTLLR